MDSRGTREDPSKESKIISHAVYAKRQFKLMNDWFSLKLQIS